MVLEGYKIINVEEQSYGSGHGVKITFLVGDIKKFLVVFSNQELYNRASKIVAGEVVELDLEQDGKYLKLNNIGNVITDTVAKTQVDEVETKKKSNSYSRTSPEERDSIQRQTAIKASVELVAASGIKFKTVNDAYKEAIEVAKGFYDFISGIKIVGKEKFNDFNSDIKIAEEEV
jgi:hypothetical protein